MSKQQEIEYLSKAADISNNPRYFENYIITLYNYCAKDKNFVDEKKEILNSLIYKYLKLYPYNKKISKIYNSLNF